MKCKACPIAEIDCDTGKYRVTYQHVRGGLIQGKFFDGTSEGFDEALAFARTITAKPSVFAEVPAGAKSAALFEQGEGDRLNRDRSKGYKDC